MASGNYLSAADHGDENAMHSDEKFFLPTRHRDKIDYACNAFPRKAVPGTTWVYRSSDTYLLGAAMSEFLRQQRGKEADLFRNLVVADIWQALAPESDSSDLPPDSGRSCPAVHGLWPHFARGRRGENRHVPATHPARWQVSCWIGTCTRLPCSSTHTIVA